MIKKIQVITIPDEVKALPYLAGEKLTKTKIQSIERGIGQSQSNMI